MRVVMGGGERWKLKKELRVKEKEAEKIVRQEKCEEVEDTSKVVQKV
jgi:hypothetical protein